MSTLLGIGYEDYVLESVFFFPISCAERRATRSRTREIRKLTNEFQTKSNKRNWVKLYDAPDAGIHGKAAAGRTIKGDGSSMQPRKRDYGGLGLARPTSCLSLRDPSFLPLLHQEFAEHNVPGFVGKQRTNAMKKQLDGNMHWCQLPKQKTQFGSKTFSFRYDT
eukprot:scaffold296620_cov33-Attheya_sp.AAC.2